MVKISMPHSTDSIKTARVLAKEIMRIAYIIAMIVLGLTAICWIPMAAAKLATNVEAALAEASG